MPTDNEDQPILSRWWSVFVAVFKQLYRPAGSLACYFAVAYALWMRQSGELACVAAALAGGTAYLRTKDKQTEANNVSQ